jgi:hypothetical protein
MHKTRRHEIESRNSSSLRHPAKQNKALDERLARWSRHQLAESRRTWRNVRPAAVALVEFAYESLTPMEPSTLERVAQWQTALFSYPVLGWSLRMPPPGPHSVSYSNEQIRFVQREIRAALVWLVLAPDRDTPVGGLCWKQPPAQVAVNFFHSSVDQPRVEVWVTPPQLQFVFAAGAVLAAALPWLRFCELCGRLFFKVKRQRVCGSRCKVAFQSRERSAHHRKGDETERRGRKRKDYARLIAPEHAAWIRAARERARQVGDGEVQPGSYEVKKRHILRRGKQPAIDLSRYSLVRPRHGSWTDPATPLGGESPASGPMKPQHV